MGQLLYAKAQGQAVRGPLCPVERGVGLDEILRRAPDHERVVFAWVVRLAVEVALEPVAEQRLLADLSRASADCVHVARLLGHDMPPQVSESLGLCPPSLVGITLAVAEEN